MFTSAKSSCKKSLRKFSLKEHRPCQAWWLSPNTFFSHQNAEAQHLTQRDSTPHTERLNTSHRETQHLTQVDSTPHTQKDSTPHTERLNTSHTERPNSRWGSVVQHAATSDGSVVRRMFWCVFSKGYLSNGEWGVQINILLSGLLLKSITRSITGS